ncbi:MAG: methyltransferase domain-containing protein [Acidobacteria bacterium]|nr:methyltransferase domain-containing protein [Acidobacteriota bacterium]
MTQAPNIADPRMREDWNRRAREDAHYYVAFGRHGQDEAEFYATAHEMVYGLEYELKRLPPGNPRARRALEIGCGPGRLLKPLSRHFGEIHGVDVSDEMVSLARQRLRDIPHAHVHVSPGADLRQFADESFDFVYSYAVFQHIPSREVVDSYLREARRVLRTGGLFWFQVNGLPDSDAPADTWSGVRFTAEDIVEFANENDFQMYTLEGVRTQYMWTSLRKRPDGWFRDLPLHPPQTGAHIRRISNPHGTEPGVPRSGRFACASLWITDLHPECGLNHVRVRIGDAWGTANYIAAPLASGEQQLNVLLPDDVPTGLVPVRLEWLGTEAGREAVMRVVPPSPQVPRLLAVTDATDLLSGTRITHGNIKAILEEVSNPQDVSFRLDGQPLQPNLIHWADRRTPRLELVIPVPEGTAPGWHSLEVQARKQRFAPVGIEIYPH